MKIKICVLLLFLQLPALRGAVITWTNTAGGSWQTAANWQPNQVPGAADTAVISASGSYTVTLANHVTLSSLTLGGGTGLQTLQLTAHTFKATNLATVAANGEFLMQGGSLQGNMIVAVGGLLRFAGGTQKDIYQLSLTTAGTVQWQGGTLAVGWTPTTLVTNTGTWEINSDANISQGIGGPTPIFVNAGTGIVRKVGGVGTTSINNLRFINAGLVEAQQGIISFASMDATVLGGVFTAAAGSTIQLGSGTYTENGAVFNGPGVRQMQSGTLTLVNNIMGGLSLNGGTVQVAPTFQNAGAITNLTINGAELTGTNEVSGALTVANGGLNGKLTVRAGGTLTFSSAAQKDLTQFTLINNGTVKWNGGTLSFGWTPTTVVTNGLWEINSDATISQGIGGPVPQFVNTATGIVRKIGGAGTSQINNLQFINAGLVEAQQGIISFTSMDGAILGGTFSSFAGATIQLSSGSYTENGAVFNGPGIVRMSGGTLTLVTNIMPGLSHAGGTVQISNAGTFQASGAITNLTINGAELAGTNQIAGTMIVADGGINGNLTVRPGGTLTFSTAAQKDLTQLTLINNGTVKWQGGTLSFGWTPTTFVTNAGLWEINSDATISQGIGGPTPRFVNTSSGIVRKIGGVGTTTINSLQFINAGLVEAEQGIISFAAMDGAILGGTFTAQAGATIQLSNGTFTENGAVFNGPGIVRMSGGTLTLVNNILPGLSLAGGTVQLTSAGTFQASGAITNLVISGGELNGTYEVAGNLTVIDGGIAGHLTVRPGGTLTLSTASQKDLTQLTLVNNGTVKWQGGTLSFGWTPTTLVTNTGLWEINSDATISQGIGGPTPRFVNMATGIVRKIGGVGTTTFNSLQLVNAGLFETEQGTLSFGAMDASILGGTFTAAAASVIQLSSGTYSENGAVWNGDGERRMQGGALTLVNDTMSGLSLNGGTVQVLPTYQAAGAITNLTLNGAELVGSNEVAGALIVANGGISGVLTVRPGGVLTLSTGNQKDLTQLTLINNGTVKWQGGTLSFGWTPTTLVTNSGLWEINSDATISQGIGGPTPRFVNTATGIVRKIGGVGTTTFNNTHVINAGLFETVQGTISFAAMDASILGGSFTSAADSTIQLTSGTYSENGAVWTGAGLRRMQGGTLTLVKNIMSGLSLNGGTVQVLPTFQSAGAITNLTLNGAELAGTNEIAGEMIVVDGGISGNLTVRASGTLTISSAAQKDLTQLTLNNNGTVKWLGGTLSFGWTPTTLVTNTGLWEINSDATITQGIGGPTPVFVNLGTLKKITATGLSTLNSLTFNNLGVVEAQSGTIRFPNNQTFSAGTLRLAGGRIESTGTLTVSGGVLEGTGSFGGSQFTGGTISPGLAIGAGKITFTSGLKLNAATTVRLTAFNATPGTGYDQLAVTGAVDLGGATLNLGNIASLPVGAKLTFIDNDASDATTNTFNGFPEGSLFTHGFQLFRVRYGSGGNDVALVRDDGGVRLTSITLLSDNTYHLTGLGTNNGNYIITATTNFTTWDEVGTVQADSGGVFQIIDPDAALYRFRFYRSFGPGVSQ